MLKVEVAKTLPYSKERNLDRVGDLIYKLRESGRMEGFLPSVSDRVSTFVIDYDKTQAINFREVISEVIGEKEGFSLPFLTRLMSWSKTGDTKTALEFQSVVAFPYDQFEGILATVVEEASKSSYKGKMDYDGGMNVIPEKERYTQHIIIPMLKSLISNGKLPTSYTARVGQLSSKEFELIPEEYAEKLRKRIPEFPDMKFGEMAGNKNFLARPICLEFIGSKISNALKHDLNFQQQLIATSQNFINLFGYEIDVLDSGKVGELFIKQGIKDGAYAVPVKHLTTDFVHDICEAHRRNVMDKTNSSHFDEKGNFSEDKYNSNLVKMENSINAYETWVEKKLSNNTFVTTDKPSYDGLDYDEWLEQKNAELAQHALENSEEGHVEEDDDLSDF